MLPKVLAILAVVVAMASCEEDFNTIGSDIIEQDLDIPDTTFDVVAYSRLLTPVQTNDLPVYQLGVYNDPVYGKSTANFLGQLTLERTEPTFGDTTELESVILYIPFFSEATVVNDSTTTYTLDSIYGGGKVNISIYESNFFLRDFDPETGFEEPQKYYSNQGEIFDDFLGEELVTITDFSPSDEAIEVNDTTTLPPGLRVELPVDFFQEKIIDQEGSAVLIDQNNFKEFFRGIYFEVSAPNDDATLFLFDPEEAQITLNYSFAVGDGTRDDASFSLLFGGVNVNTFSNEVPSPILEALQNPDITNGEENLYVRGGAGIATIIELFGDDADENGVADQLEQLRIRKWLINEANLKFYVNQNALQPSSNEPERIVVYDATNGTYLIDYAFDLTSGEDPEDAFSVHFGKLQRGSDDNGEFYKLKITNHVRNLLNTDSTNVALGVIVSQNVKIASFQDLQIEQAPGLRNVPSASVVSPEGTVLYGNNTSNEAKRLKLELFYTEPE
jgi:hypothetical protein